MPPITESRIEPHNDVIAPFLRGTRIAYFSMEMAIRPEMHTYSGGLGVLAGDTAHSCADLELPTVFVTLISRRGYLRQEFDESGWQIEAEDPWRPEDFATALRAKVAVPIGDREVWVRPWLYVLTSSLGQSVPVLLLDTDLAENHPDDRKITDRLYGGDAEYRLKQEIVLGIGGLRLLSALGFNNVGIYHLNEGHAALLALDLLRRHPQPPDQVRAGEIMYDLGRVRERCIFTTHTPVEAGHDKFPYALVEKLLPDYMDCAQIKLIAGADMMNMTKLALMLSGFINGVAERHAETAARMFPGYRIRAVTNGVHLPTWAHIAFCSLYNRHFHTWRHEPEVLVQADQLPSETILAARRTVKQDLIDFVAARAGVKLDPAKPIIGYARRMTSYKQPELLFTSLDELRRVNARYPFQVVLSGKAHPLDYNGKRLIQNIHRHIRELRDEIPIVFLPNYDLAGAKAVVAGVDVWLNTPVPPMEASGTSGMKAALNGALNLSVLDGWWLEACIEGVTGWAIGHDGGVGAAQATAGDLYEKLEKAVLPLYYEDPDGWMRMMKASISKIPPYFNTQRMMRRYGAEGYLRAP
jgi:starch phosphorylase